MNGKFQSKVDFIGIGVQKAATTWLFRCMEAHPDIRGALQTENKELNFFNHHYNKGYIWYHSKFDFGQWKTGEFSVLYFSDKNVPYRIFKYNPDIKLIVSLRNPLDRAFSHHLHLIKEGHLPQNMYEFSKALPHNPSYLEMGKYATFLRFFLEWFDRRQLHVVLLDDIIKKPRNVLCDLFNFIGVDKDFLPGSWNQKIYTAHTYRSHQLNIVLDSVSNIFRRLGGRTILDAVKRTFIPTWIRQYNQIEFNDDKVPPMTINDRKILYEFFSDEIELTEQIIGKDLSSWRS